MADIRSFVAIELTEEAAVRLSRLQKELKQKSPPDAVRWTRPESIHLTLQFLGDVAPERIQLIGAALREVCRERPPFSFELKDVGAFPNPRRPRVIWVGVAEPSGALAALYKQVTGALEPLGFEAENRPFAPHLTLGRAARQASPRALAELGDLIVRSEPGSLGRVPVDRVILMRSDLKPSGSVYTPQVVVELGG